MAAFYESSTRVNVEFLRSAQTGAGRVIRFNHRPDALPPQLKGRLDIEKWMSFMQSCDSLAKTHPYVQKPKAKDYGKWAACFGIGSVIGIFCANPDVGDYSEWEREAQAVVEQYRPMFEETGCSLTLGKGRDYWMQIDLVAPPPILILPGEPPLESRTGGPPLSPFQSMKGIDVSNLRTMNVSGSISGSDVVSPRAT